MHKAPAIPDFNLRTCLFGEHLLANADGHKTIALVESEKTAVIASASLPQHIWMATGGKSNLNARLLLPLKGRKVILYPDLGAFQEWYDLAHQLSHIASISVSTILERNATTEEREEGLDLADYLIRLRLEQQM